MDAAQQVIIGMPTDDELYVAFIDAIRNGVGESTRDMVNKISWFIENAKDEIKNFIVIDPQNGLVLDMTIPKGNQILASFVGKQWFLMRNALKILLSTVGASTFADFIVKMKNDPASMQTTVANLSKIMTIFFVNLSKKYLTKETEATIGAKITALFS